MKQKNEPIGSNPDHVYNPVACNGDKNSTVLPTIEIKLYIIDLDHYRD